MKKLAGGRWTAVAARAGAVLALVALAGCGAENLYEPPVAPFGVQGRLALPSQAEDVAILGDYAFVACGQAGIVIVDISDPANPVLVKMLDTVKYASAIRVASLAYGGTVTDVAFVVEGTEGITTYDITDPVNAFSYHQGTTAVDGNGLFIEQPEDPSLPTIVYLAESWKGMRIFESDTAIPGLLHYNGVFASTRGYANAVVVVDGFAYVADDQMGLAVLDVRTRTLGGVVMVSSCDTPGLARGVDAEDGHIFIADDIQGLTVMSIAEEGSPAMPVPHELARMALPGKSRAIVVRDHTAFIAAQDGGVHLVDVSNPAAPRSLGTVVTAYATGIAVATSGIVAVSDRDEGLLVLAGGHGFTDTQAPATVSDLAATGVNASTIRLSWHAPGNDGLSGRAASYDVRWSLAPITNDTEWEAATQATGEPAPAAAGTAESFDVGGLAASTTYYLALRTADAAPNWSGRSNTASASTTAGNVPPAITGGSITPEGGTADTLFTFEATYTDGDGDAAAEATVLVDGTPHAMALVSGAPGTGALYRYQSAFAVGEHEHRFRFADGFNPAVQTALAEGPLVGRSLVLMGSPPDEAGRDTDETQHAVAFPDSAWVADHEVTQDEYQARMGVNPSRFAGGNLPVETVTWFDAVAYCDSLSLHEGLTPAYTIAGGVVTWDRNADGYRLPTEAEWEAAARAGTQTAFAGGDLTEQACGFDPVLDALGWYCGNAGATTHPVMAKSANANGLFDMHGNVWEWCWDWYVADLGAGLAWDPAGPAGGSQRVIRGGSWYHFAREARSAARAPYWPNSGDDVVGFRVARTVHGSGRAR